VIRIIKNVINALFPPKTYQSELEEYINANNPQTTGDVDFYIRKFDRKKGEYRSWW
jgi:hypothetical protein